MHIDSDTRRLIDSARRAPKLTTAEERECLERFQRFGDRSAAQRLARANLRHVVFTALRYRGYETSLADLVSSGNVGLMKAMQRFDLTRPVRFSTYAAYWIRAYVVGELVGNWSQLSGGGALSSGMFFRIRRERARCRASTTQSEQTRELAERLGVSEQRSRQLQQHLDHRGVSLDASRGPADTTLHDELSTGENPASALARKREVERARSLVERARRLLDARERYILDQRLAAESGDRLTLAELAERFGVSRERVRQLEERTKTKLRTFVEAAQGAFVAPREAPGELAAAPAPYLLSGVAGGEGVSAAPPRVSGLRRAV